MKNFKLVPAALILAAAAACSNGTSTSRASNSAFQPTPASAASGGLTNLDMLGRFRGQKEFLNVSPYDRHSGLESARSVAAASPSASGERRAVQEADVFKIGKKDEKILYLLNHSRGLQVISFANGPEKPEIVGRVQATGNYPNSMYFDEARQRLLVLENNWYDRESSSSSSASRLVVYNVADNAAPSVAEIVDLDGSLADSRMVGDVLYVAVRQDPSHYDRSSDEVGKGFITSLNLAGDKVSKAGESYELTLPISRRENMNIVEVEHQGSYQYYLVAILSNSRWGWWDQTSVVEVVDISDPAGAAKAVLIAKPTGVVQERSQTLIKNGTLIITSNYTPNGQDAKDRLAVETFRFPSAQENANNYLDEEEASFRLKALERQAKKNNWSAHSAEYRAMLEDANVGLRGRFVKTAAKKLQKIVGDSFISVGATNGLHASLRDVRYSSDGKLLYAFWVPTDRSRLLNDPLEVFDISQPETKVAHLNHLEFDGRVERAIPLSFKGKEYILGLGYVEPAVNNETRVTYPQAIMFEMVRRGNAVAALSVGQISLEHSDVWGAFSGQDKYTDSRMSADGTGVVLFTASRNSGEWAYRSGGKLIGFDMNKIERGEPVFTEGGFIPAESGWLRRVFNNPEIDGINTFSNRALGTYTAGNSLATIGAPEQTIEAISVLELARNMVAYETLTLAGEAKGVQIIRNDSWMRGRPSDRSTTELRLVERNRADAEVSQALRTVTLDGQYKGHVVTNNGGQIIVVTQLMSKKLNERDHYWETVGGDVLVYGVTLDASDRNKFAVSNHTPLAVGEQDRHWVPVNLLDSGAAGQYLTIGDKLYRFMFARSGEVAFAVAPITLSGCPTVRSDNGETNLTLIEVSHNLFFSYAKSVKDDERALTYKKNYLVPVTSTGAMLGCGKAINIPGKPLFVGRTNTTLITEDTSLSHFAAEESETTEAPTTRGRYGVRSGTSYRPVTRTNYAALKLDVEAGVAALSDMDESDQVTGNALFTVNDALVYVKANSSRSAFGGIEPRYGMGRPWRPDYEESSAGNALVTLAVDSSGQFLKTSLHVPSLGATESSRATLLGVFQTGPSWIGLVRDGRRVGAFTMKDRELKMHKVQAVDAKFAKGTPSKGVTIHDTWSTHKANFDLRNMSFEIPQGDYGIVQLYLAN